MAARVSKGKRAVQDSANKVSAKEAIARILKFLELFPEATEEIGGACRTRAFWEAQFRKDALRQRLLDIAREFPLLTNQLPLGNRKAWEKRFASPVGTDSGALFLKQFVYFLKQVAARPKKDLYKRGDAETWRETFGPNEKVQRVRPDESDEYLHNPHRGTTTFQRFQGDETYPFHATSDTHGPVEFHSVKQLRDNVKFIPRTTLTYCRWPWQTLEPRKGKYRWDIVDNTLRLARERGQTAQLRFQPYTLRVDYAEAPTAARRHPPECSVNVPDWYWDTGAKWIRQGHHGKNEPDCNDPRYIRHFGEFISAFAKRYDGHPALESIDIAYAGFWGESGGNSTPATARTLIDMYRNSFRKTQLVSMLTTHGCRYAAAQTKATRRHIGWRADCFGDFHQANTPDVPSALCWNHTFDCYPRHIELDGLRDAWKTAPVTMETCGNVTTWFMAGYDLDRIIEEGYRYHMSVFMPKSVFFPEAFLDRLIEFDKYIGYRFVLRQMLLPLEGKPGGRAHLEFFLDNVGCAPIYRPYRLAVRFTQGKKAHIVPLKQDIRSWLPGHFWFQENIRLPEGLSAGNAKIDLGIVNEAGAPVVRFAIKSADPDGWHPMTSILIHK